LLEAFHQLKARRNQDAVSLRIAGYVGPEHRGYVEELKRQIREWGLSNAVSFDGTLDLPQKADFYRDLDLFAMSAVYDDPKGLALLEAMACGVPVVAPRRGTYSEMIERTGGGVLVSPDNVDALVEVLTELQADPARRAHLGATGASGVRQHYSADRMAESALAIYETLTSRRPPSG
jgi:glycosyltransferase involved in cell wall biosynthesis